MEGKIFWLILVVSICDVGVGLFHEQNNAYTQVPDELELIRKQVDKRFVKSSSYASSTQESPRGPAWDTYWSADQAASRGCFTFMSGSDEALRSLAQMIHFVNTCKSDDECEGHKLRLWAGVLSYMSVIFQWESSCGGRGCSENEIQWTTLLTSVVAVVSQTLNFLSDSGLILHRKQLFCSDEKTTVGVSVFSPYFVGKSVADLFTNAVGGIDALYAYKKRQCDLRESGYLIFSQNRPFLLQLTMWVVTLIMYDSKTYQPDKELQKLLYKPLVNMIQAASEKNEIPKTGGPSDKYQVSESGTKVMTKIREVMNGVRDMSDIDRDMVRSAISLTIEKIEKLKGEGVAGADDLHLCFQGQYPPPPDAKKTEAEQKQLRQSHIKAMYAKAYIECGGEQSWTTGCEGVTKGSENTMLSVSGKSCCTGSQKNIGLPDLDIPHHKPTDDEIKKITKENPTSGHDKYLSSILGPACLVFERWRAVENEYRNQIDKEWWNFWLGRLTWLNGLFNSWSGLVLGIIDEFQLKTVQSRNCLKQSLALASAVMTVINTAISFSVCWFNNADEPATFMKEWAAASSQFIKDENIGAAGRTKQLLSLVRTQGLQQTTSGDQPTAQSSTDSVSRSDAADDPNVNKLTRLVLMYRKRFLSVLSSLKKSAKFWYQDSDKICDLVKKIDKKESKKRTADIFQL